MIREKFVFRPIGVIRTPHTDPSKTPIQPVFSTGIHGSVEIFPPYAGGLKDLEGFSHIYLFYCFHRAVQKTLEVRPFLEQESRGIFATRSPQRPNPLGMSLVRLVGIKGNLLDVEDVDVLDGTPLLDIKPYIKRYDSREHVRSGWQDAIPDYTAERMGSRKGEIG